ncbi:MAG: TlpA family protein disulfide reductase [Hydrogenophaga sp.]|jgi:thiol-disulfide isomerase/thioredoxin|uniref:TlpA family protein disulfide reductase n=1 Tax=Hydrogenophaga sp. TaxID=1904254 RepID=UPI001D96EA57|nr:TlpA disulfide reductase family protein [Hydrogenophaga sp.]MBW0171211.1 TlpA family protein disulfide reductase [Hydrogenophaga sp.]MBW0185431.1 TlpA family protein disulfide reductase [Hydrogenophaga sp.]
MKLQRRTLVMAGVAVAAGGGGALVATRRFQLQPVMSEAELAFWTGEFEGPHGERVRMADFRGQPLLVNFWATWCPPCVEELPMLNRFHQVHATKGWKVLGLAVDQPSAVRSFLLKLPLNFPVGMAGFAGTELSRSLGNPSGALPFTVVFGADGALLHRKMGKVSDADLAQWAELA